MSDEKTSLIAKAKRARELGDIDLAIAYLDQAESITPSQAGTFADSIGSGATLGFSDEIAGVVGATAGTILPEDMGGFPKGTEWKDAYEGISGYARENKKAFAERNPGADLALELAGGFATGGAGAGRVAGTKALSGAPKYARYAAAGTVPGAIAGAGYAEPGETIKGIGSGALTGAAIGAAIPAAGTLAKETVMKGAEVWKKPITYANRKLAEAMERDGLTPEKVTARLTRIGDQATISDAGGENIKGLARAATSFPGKAKDQAERFFNRRQWNQGNRVIDRLRETLSVKDDFFAGLDDIAGKMKTMAGPAYNEAWKVKIPMTPKLKSLMERPAMANAWAKAKRIAADEGEELPEVFRLNEAGDKVIGITSAPNMKAWHYMKGGLDDVVGGHKNQITGKIEGNEGYAADKVRRETLAELRRLNPKYAEANKIYSGLAQMKDALFQGKKLFSDDADITARAFNAMADSEKEMFRLGAAKAIMNRIEGAADGHNVYNKIFQNKTIRRKLKTIFPDPKSYRQFQSFMLKEKEMFETRGKVLGGSPTARIEGEKADMLVDPGALMEAGKGNYGNAAAQMARSVAARAKLPTESIRNELGPSLFSNDKAVQNRTLQGLIDGKYIDPGIQAKNQARMMMLLGGSGAVAPGQLPKF